MRVTCNQRLVWHVVAILLSVLGSIVLFADRFIIQQEVRREVTLNNESEYLRQWLNDTTAITAKFFLFNITNSHLIESGEDAGIHIREIPPIVYDVQRQRKIITMNDSAIEYQPISFFAFNPILSHGNASLEQQVNMVNIPLAVIMRNAESADKLVRRASSLLARASRSHVFTERSANQILFEGYRDPLFALVKAVEERARLPGADRIPDVFSLMKDQNGNPFSGNWTVLRGHDVVDDTLRLVRWNHADKLKFFRSDSKCNELKGNDGSKFPSGLKQSDVLFLFLVADFCSAVPFTFDSYSSVGSIRTMRFKFNFNDSRMDCMSDSGSMDVSACHSDAPIFLSGPHFFGGADTLAHGIHGLSPNQSLHESYIDVEPMSGILLRVAIRVQVNVKVQKDKLFHMTRHLTFSEKVIPVLWMEQFAEASDQSLSELDRQIFVKVRALKYTSWSLIVIGSLMVMMMHAVICLKTKRTERKAEQLVVPQDSPTE